MQKIDGIMNLLDMSGVHVKLRDKNALRERYRVRHNGDNAFERTDIALTSSIVVVESYDARNQSIGTAVIVLPNMAEPVDKKILYGKVHNLKTKLRGMAAQPEQIK